MEMNMKIEKPILVPMNNDLAISYQQSCNIRILETAVISLVDSVNEMQTDDLQAKYNALQAKHYAKISECNRLRQEVAVLKNQADTMSKPDQGAESWPDAATKEAAENPRVGDVYATKVNNPDLEVIEVVETVIKYRYLHGAKISFVHSRDGWVGYLGAGAIKSFLVSRGPEPKAEKPLRDGDVMIGNQSGDPYIIDKNSGRILYMKHKEDFGARHVTYGFNLYDLAAAVQRGEKVVTLTKEEMNSIIKDYKSLTNCHRTSADDKLRAAIGGGQ
jgi:hypothetical protein